MTLKHQLQDYLFDSENTPATFAENSTTKKLSSILVYLQTMANILDDIELNNSNKTCLKLTSAQYKMMYYAPVLQFNATNLIVTLKEKSKEWVLSGGSQHKTSLCQ